jgi:hypothetical protein
MRAAFALICLALTAPVLAQDGDDPAHPLGPLGPVLEAAEDPGCDVTPREDALVFVGRAADGQATLLHDPGAQRPLTIRVEVALEAATGADDGPPQGAGLVYMTGPEAFVAFVLLPDGRTGVFSYQPGKGLKARIKTGWGFDSSTFHRLGLTHDGDGLTFWIDDERAGKMGNDVIRHAQGPVGLVVLGEATCVLRNYTARVDQADRSE